MPIKNYNFKFSFTAENVPLRKYSSDHEIMIKVDAVLIFPDLAGAYIDASYILEAFDKLGFPNPVFSYNKISSSKDITFSEFRKEFELTDPFGIQIIKDPDLGYWLNLNSPRDVILKKR